MDILQNTRNSQDSGMTHKNPNVSDNKHLDSFFKLLTELIKNVKSNVIRDISHSDENRSYDGMEETSASNETSEDESSDALTEESEEPNQIESKDSLLEGIINSWVCLVPLISEDKFDDEFPAYFETFESLVRYHKNQAIKVASCEAIITLNDLNERLPVDKKYDIEIQPLVDKLNSYARGCSNDTSNNNKFQKKQRQIWLNLAKALEADKCVVELPFINLQNKFLINRTKNRSDKRKLYQTRSKKETFWTNWPEAMTIKYIKNHLGAQFNELLQSHEFTSKIFELLEHKDSWHLAQKNSPLSMIYVQIRNQTPPGLTNDVWANKWSNRRNQGQKDSLKTTTRNTLFM